MKRKTPPPPETLKKIDKFRQTAGEKIRTALREYPMTKRELQEKTGLTYLTILNITSGKSYSFESLIQVLDTLEMELRIRKGDGK